MNQLSLFELVSDVDPPPGVVLNPGESACDGGGLDLELAALRRELYHKGRRMGRDLGVESLERFGTPIYRLSRVLVVRWLAVLDEQARRGNGK